jgi:hypothetical protein
VSFGFAESMSESTAVEIGGKLKVRGTASRQAREPVAARQFRCVVVFALTSVIHYVSCSQLSLRAFFSERGESVE